MCDLSVLTASSRAAGDVDGLRGSEVDAGWRSFSIGFSDRAAAPMPFMLDGVAVYLRGEAESDCQISVVAMADTWSIQSAMISDPLMFVSGTKAEEKARSLAQLIAMMGRDVRVLVHDRNQALAGTWRYFAA
jgi:hypothetical protein